MRHRWSHTSNEERRPVFRFPMRRRHTQDKLLTVGIIKLDPNATENRNLEYQSPLNDEKDGSDDSAKKSFMVSWYIGTKIPSPRLDWRTSSEESEESEESSAAWSWARGGAMKPSPDDQESPLHSDLTVEESSLPNPGATSKIVQFSPKAGIQSEEQQDLLRVPRRCGYPSHKKLPHVIIPPSEYTTLVLDCILHLLVYSSLMKTHKSRLVSLTVMKVLNQLTVWIQRKCLQLSHYCHKLHNDMMGLYQQYGDVSSDIFIKFMVCFWIPYKTACSNLQPSSMTFHPSHPFLLYRKVVGFREIPTCQQHKRTLILSNDLLSQLRKDYECFICIQNIPHTAEIYVELLAGNFRLNLNHCRLEVERLLEKSGFTIDSPQPEHVLSCFVGQYRLPDVMPPKMLKKCLGRKLSQARLPLLSNWCTQYLA